MTELNYTPLIGKNVIETLTLGMYENSLFIYREYVQNAADQIDVAVEEGILHKKSGGRIEIDINKDSKLISIKDNATGIGEKDVLKFLGDVANSQKDRTIRKGFRGIGRLGGLGYCDKLIFETTHKGEDIKSTITLDALLLKQIIENKADTRDAAAVISVITTLQKEETNLDDHYFKVTLENVTKEELLNVNKVKNYLSVVAPIPFNPDFEFSEKIYNFFKNKNIKIDEYDIHLKVNNEKLFKAYKNIFYDKKNDIIPRLIDVAFFEIRNEDYEVIAISWYGISKVINRILSPDNIARGFRLRKENIQIGSEDTLNHFFKEDRFNHHFIGEIHVIGDAFIPNARRDYFNDNKTVQLFEKELKKQFEQLYKIAHFTSDIISRYKEITEYLFEKEKFDTQYFRSNKEKKRFFERKEKSKRAIIKLEKIKNKIIELKPAQTIYNSIVSKPVLLNIKQKENIDTPIISEPQLSKLTNEQKDTVLSIFTILEKELSVELAERIKQIIINRYN